jgi:hypothetical protein
LTRSDLRAYRARETAGERIVSMNEALDLTTAAMSFWSPIGPKVEA